VSPKHLAVGADSSPSEDIDNNSDDQVDMGLNCGQNAGTP